MTHGLAILRERYPWPISPPDVPPDPHGWFGDGNARLLRQVITPRVRLIVELGSWLGLSTRFLLEHAPNAVVLAVDHWRGNPGHNDAEAESKWSTLYETFLRNCWDYRHRLVPMRTTTLPGMDEIAALGLVPDIVYIDADHTKEAVYADVCAAHRLFPSAALVGDDWLWDSVRTAIVEFLSRHRNMRCVAIKNAWRLRSR